MDHNEYEPGKFRKNNELLPIIRTAPGLPGR